MKDENGIMILEDLSDLCNKQFYDGLLNSIPKNTNNKDDLDFGIVGFEYKPLQWSVSVPKAQSYYNRIWGDKQSGNIYELQRGK